MLKREAESRGGLAAAYLAPGIVAGVAAGAVAASFWGGWPEVAVPAKSARVAVHLHESACRDSARVTEAVEVVLTPATLPPGVPLAGFERGWDGVATSRSEPIVAVWSQDAVLESHDDGRSFARILDSEGAVIGVAVGAAGTVFALRDRLGVWRAGASAPNPIKTPSPSRAACPLKL